MRFDDRLETALRQADENHVSVSAKWQQLVDVLAQNPAELDFNTVEAGLFQVRRLLPDVALSKRVECITAIAGRIRSAPLVQLLAGDAPPVASAAISGADLTDAEWADIIPHLPTRARGFLRNRKDIGGETRRALMIA